MQLGYFVNTTGNGGSARANGYGTAYGGHGGDGGGIYNTGALALGHGAVAGNTAGNGGSAEGTDYDSDASAAGGDGGDGGGDAHAEDDFEAESLAVLVEDAPSAQPFDFELHELNMEDVRIAYRDADGEPIAQVWIEKS